MEDSGLKQTGETTGVWRTLDASANRCAEALRVLEDVLRFALEDAHLARELKAVRHDLAVVLAQGELQQRLRLRVCRELPRETDRTLVREASFGDKDQRREWHCHARAARLDRTLRTRWQELQRRHSQLLP